MSDIISPNYSKGCAGNEPDDCEKPDDSKPDDSPIFSVPIKEKRQEMNQSDTETSPNSTIPIAEKSETPTNKEEETDATSLGNTSVRAEQKSEVFKTSDDSRQEKRREKKERRLRQRLTSIKQSEQVIGQKQATNTVFRKPTESFS